MMKLTKSSRAFRRATAVALATAMTFSLPVANDASAATKKVPSLSTKKKTLYVKGGTKTTTLKVKKNKAKKIVKTKWTTSKKSVAKISKKKATSVKVTAVKKGTATITGKVTYKIGKKTKKVTLKCKVTVKAEKTVAPTKAPAVSAKPTANVTAAPSADVTAAPSADVTAAPSADVTAAPSADVTETPAVVSPASITVSSSAETIGTTDKFNKATLVATVKAADGTDIKDAQVEYASSDEKVATVDKDGVVTGVADGKATITATVKDTKVSASVEVTVDGTAPAINEKESKVINKNSVSVALSEAVSVNAEKFSATITKKDAKDALATVKAADAKLSEDGKTLTLTTTETLEAGTYTVKIADGLTDAYGNTVKADTSVELVKDASVIKKIVPASSQIPALYYKYSDGSEYVTKKSAKIYYTIKDQYGDQLEYAQNKGLEVTAQIKGTTYPVTATITNSGESRGYITIEGASTMREGTVISFNVTEAVSKLSSNFEVELIKYDQKEVETVTDIASLTAKSDVMKNGGTSTEPVFSTTGNDATNVFTLDATLLNKYGDTVTNGEITVVSNDTSKLQVYNEETKAYVQEKGKTVTVKAKDGLKVKVTDAGTASLTVYAASNAKVSKTFTVKANKEALTGITVADFTTADVPIKDSVNTEKNLFELGLTSAKGGFTGTTVEDLAVVPLNDTAKKVDFKIVAGTGANVDGDRTKANKLYVNVTPKKGTVLAVNEKLQYVVCKKGDEANIDPKTGLVLAGKTAVVSAVKTINPIRRPDKIDKITVDTINENTVMTGATTKVKFSVTNIYGEDVTDVANITVLPSNEAVLKAELDAYNADKKERTISVTGVSKAVASFNVVVGDKTVNVPVSVGSTQTASKVSFPNSVAGISVIQRDAKELTKAEKRDRYYNNSGKTYKVTKVQFKDQYGNSQKVSKELFDSFATGTVTNGNFESNSSIKFVGLSYKPTTGFYEEATNDVQYVGVYSTADKDTSTEIYFYSQGTVGSVDKSDALGTITVNTTSARESEAGTVTVGGALTGVVGGKVTLPITVKNNKGEEVDITGQSPSITSTNNKVAVELDSSNKKIEVTFNDAVDADTNKTDLTVTYDGNKTAVVKDLVITTVAANQATLTLSDKVTTDAEYDAANAKLDGESVKVNITADNNTVFTDYQNVEAKATVVYKDANGKQLTTENRDGTVNPSTGDASFTITGNPDAESAVVTVTANDKDSVKGEVTKTYTLKKDSGKVEYFVSTKGTAAEAEAGKITDVVFNEALLDANNSGDVEPSERESVTLYVYQKDEFGKVSAKNLSAGVAVSTAGVTATTDTSNKLKLGVPNNYANPAAVGQVAVNIDGKKLILNVTNPVAPAPFVAPEV